MGPDRPSRRWVAATTPHAREKKIFLKSFHPVLGVPGMTDLVDVDLEESDARDGWILESRIEKQGGKEVSPLPIQPLLSRILSSALLYGFLRSMEITQEISSGSEGEIYHEPCVWM